MFIQIYDKKNLKEVGEISCEMVGIDPEFGSIFYLKRISDQKVEEFKLEEGFEYFIFEEDK